MADTDIKPEDVASENRDDGGDDEVREGLSRYTFHRALTQRRHEDGLSLARL